MLVMVLALLSGVVAVQSAFTTVLLSFSTEIREIILIKLEIRKNKLDKVEKDSALVGSVWFGACSRSTHPIGAPRSYPLPCQDVSGHKCILSGIIC